MSVEEGFAVEAAAESSRTAFGSDADAGAAIADARAYHRLAGHTVVAGRVAAAAGWGPLASRRRFAAGGAGPSEPVFDFGRETIGLLRGFDTDALTGSRALVANLDLRFPLARIQRGRGAWPIFLRTIHGAVFADAGHAWDTHFDGGDVRVSAGAELSLDLVVLHYVPLTIVSGAAWTHDPVAGRDRPAFFARIGYAF
jgi:outer membrane protein assembly factor BamA